MKKFIFKYDPNHLVGGMFSKMEKTLRTGQKNIQPKNLQKLAQFLHRDYSEVETDSQLLANLGIIKLKKQAQETKPVALYERIVIDLPVQVNKGQSLETFPAASH